MNKPFSPPPSPTQPSPTLPNEAEHHLLLALDRASEGIGAYLHAIRHRSLASNNSAELLSISVSTGLDAEELIAVERGEMNITGEEMSRLPDKYQPFSKITVTMLLGVFTFTNILRAQLRRIIEGRDLGDANWEARMEVVVTDEPQELN